MGTGTMGSLATRYMIDKGVEIVAAQDTNPRLVGKDLGEVVGLSKVLNVRIRSNMDEALNERTADIAIVSTLTKMEDIYPTLKKCIEKGINVITTSEEALYPWIISQELTTKLDRLAKEHHVTVTGGGGQDNFRVNIVSLLTGACHSIASVAVIHVSDLSKSGLAAAMNYHLGETMQQFSEAMKGRGVPLSSLRMCLEAVGADLGLTIKHLEQKAEPTIADMDVEARGVEGGIIRKGYVTGMKKLTRIDTEQGITLSGDQILKAFSDSEKKEGPYNECIIKGIPDITMRLKWSSSEAKASQVAQLVNRIPDVINSEPGYITVEKLPKLKFRVLPLQFYLKG